MIIARIYELDQQGKKLYIPKTYNKNAKTYEEVKIYLTKTKKRAYVFRSMDEIWLFFKLSKKYNWNVNLNNLKIEKEEIKKTFEEEFGEDLLKETHQELYNEYTKTTYKEHLAQLDSNIAELKKIKVEEFKEDKQKIEVLENISNLEKEKILYEEMLKKIS